MFQSILHFFPLQQMDIEEEESVDVINNKIKEENVAAVNNEVKL
jgi:hypothetical protein